MAPRPLASSILAALLLSAAHAAAVEPRAVEGARLVAQTPGPGHSDTMPHHTLGPGVTRHIPDHPDAAKAHAADDKHAPWYEKIRLSGYAQLRLNRIGASNPDFESEPNDKSIGKPGGFMFRRARLIVDGSPIEQVYVYLQSDIANTLDGKLHTAMMRDWFADIHVDKRKEIRFRVGQSKVPYGFENMQSSRNRIAFDRADALNSAVPGERDIGVMLYWAPEKIRAAFKHLNDAGLKGSGDYGMTALGVYNGQGINQAEGNDNKHVVARVTYPFQIGSQWLEVGGGGLAGRFVPKKDEGIAARPHMREARVHASVIVYPQPIGFQAEYNVGMGGELDGDRIVERGLRGGYAMTMLRVKTESAGTFIPYVRVHHYDGGRRDETNSPRHVVREIESGCEWQIFRHVELTAAYMEGVRKEEDDRQHGRLLRLQLQFMY